MEIRTSCISARSIIKKITPKERPSDQDLYRFLEGNKSRLSEKQRKKMVAIAEKDFNEFKSYMQND